MSCRILSPIKISSTTHSQNRHTFRSKLLKPNQTPDSVTTDVSGDLNESPQLVPSFISELFLQPPSSQFSSLIKKLNQALQKGLSPQLTMDGTGGNYILRDLFKQPRAIFKPIDQQAFAPANPKDYIGPFGSKSMRTGVLSGELAFREIAAYLLDQIGFAKVPVTCLVQSKHEAYNNLKNEPKQGSLQLFVKNQGTADDFSYSMFSKQQVQKIAVLDLRILNLDRNVGNLLVTENYQLVPIDHGLSMPDSFEILQDDICWMSWPQVKQPITLSCLDFIELIDPIADVSLLHQSLPFRENCLRNVRIAETFLKKAAKKNLSLFQIGQMVYRTEEDEPSVLESVISKAKMMYSAILASVHNIRKTSEEPKHSSACRRGRAFSTDQNDFEFVKNPILGKEKNVQPITELESEDDDDKEREFQLPMLGRRYLSLPPFSQDLKSPQVNWYDEKFFHYLEAFMDEAIQRKVKSSRKFEMPGGRMRSCSNLLDNI